MAAAHRAAWITLVGAALVAGLAAGRFWLGPAPIAQSPPLLSLQSMGHLAAVKVNVADVVEFTKSRTFDIPWTSWELKYAGTRVLLIVKGDCLVGADLRAARYDAVDRERRRVTVVLPQPKVLQARVNHAPPEQGGSRLYSVSNEGIEALIPGSANRMSAIDAAMRIAQEKVEQAGRSPDAMRAAKENTQALLDAAFTALGWTVTVKWQHDDSRQAGGK